MNAKRSSIFRRRVLARLHAEARVALPDGHARAQRHFLVGAPDPLDHLPRDLGLEEQVEIAGDVAVVLDGERGAGVGHVSNRAANDVFAVIALLDRLAPLRRDAELCLCGAAGRADPAHVESLFGACMDRFSGRKWALHAHGAYGLGLANIWAAYSRGVRVFDAAFGGLGGCPFAPGAAGDVATEDAAWMFARMGVATGVDVEALVALDALRQAPRRPRRQTIDSGAGDQAGASSGGRTWRGPDPWRKARARRGLGARA
ncbi:MAG: hypothetical protein ABSC25_25660 [Roseiarcus sp.]